MILSTLLLAWSCQDDLKTLEKALQAAVAKGDVKEALKLTRNAVDMGSSEHVKVVVGALPRAGLRTYWTLMEALRGLKNEDGLDFLTYEALRLKGRPEARDLAQLTLTSNSEKKDEFIVRLLDGADDDVRVACVDAIVQQERKAFIPKLIDLLEASEKGAEHVAVGTALKNLTGVDLGPSAAWRRWWEKEGRAFDCPKLDSRSNGKPETVVSHLRRNRRTQYEELRKGNKRRIAVVRGDTDRLEDVLDKLEIPYVLVSNDQIVNGAIDSGTTFAILENCFAEGRRGKPLDEALRRFVEDGGSVFASHLAMDLLWTAFPGYGGAAGCRSTELVDIVPARGTLSNPLMRDVFSKSFTLQWKVHDNGVTFRPKSEKLVVLVEGPDIGPRIGESACLAGFFRHGNKGGLVTFVAGNFAEQNGLDGHFTLQNLLLNFLIEAQENFRARGGK